MESSVKNTVIQKTSMLFSFGRAADLAARFTTVFLFVAISYANELLGN